MYILLKNLPVVPCARIEWVGECNETVKKAGGGKHRRASMPQMFVGSRNIVVCGRDELCGGKG